ncbi:hypothetical protein EDD55_102298 [Varunaivibrio sulfuroxidans]|uniref:Uncharacterized protein n=1 Tax=Varunaivibrio sulfuroxidans TaxID=1773489 RepID=A0A4R3JGC2_9PROT|nr:hypothetical protein EDD55_102298 [Varunaivibrio sulfuroxidans]
MAFEHLEFFSVFETDDKIRSYRTAYGNGRLLLFLYLGLKLKLADRSQCRVNRFDNIWYLGRRHLVLSDICGNNIGG